MFDSSHPYLSLRTVAILPLILFTPAVIAFFVSPEVWWGEYLGIFFHLSILFLISRLDAAPWAKAAGYGWIALDVLAGILMINDIPHDTAWAVRLGGHVLAGVWIIASSFVNRSRMVMVFGTITGLWLAGYSFVGTLLPEEVLRPAGICILLWFAAIAFFDRPGGVQSREPAQVVA
ncbi:MULTISPECIES: hypothetical protein [unclassified Nocardiopsis]|uniref:hypothetical protein n=1 Tax=unclassified Nocardiopsis TaxID=2649073 RepID=UPI00135A0266|nr:MULTISPECIES: hypothetical protein [unclassified Nocardiopsis]